MMDLQLITLNVDRSSLPESKDDKTYGWRRLSAFEPDLYLHSLRLSALCRLAKQ